MALTYTPPIISTQTLPVFELKTVEGQSWSSSSMLRAQAKVVVFMCNHCPYIKAIESRLIRLAKVLKSQNVPFVAICSNDPSDYPEDQPKELLKTWREKKYEFPYLIDDTQQVAKSFGAVCTPDFFVYDSMNHLSYRGRLDDSWKDESKVNKHELMNAVNALMTGSKPQLEQIPSMGCSIKWKVLK